MKVFFYIAFLLCMISNHNIRKRVLPYGVVISKSNLIVEGRVIEKKKDTYQFKITEFVKGKAPELITVRIWDEWTCDKRIKAIEKNQRLLLFLQFEEGQYSVINGSTGELFILEDNSVKTFMKDDFLKIEELKKGIQLFLKAFEYKGDLYPSLNEEYYFEQLIEQSEIDKMTEKNKFMKFILSQIKNYEIR